jgi:hypothetical protein
MRKIARYIILFSLAGSMLACESYTEGYSTDPINPTEVDVLPKLLTAAQVSQIVTLEGEMARNAGIWSRSFTGVQSQYGALEGYTNVTASTYDSPWGNIYSNSLINIKLLKNGAVKQRDPNILGIAQVMEAQLMGTTTALYGDIPFSEAGQFPTIQNPKFNAQADVYGGVQLLLDSAIANLKLPGPGGIDKQDIFYEGDLEKWIRAAYSLKARFYLHIADYAKVITNAQLGISNPAGNMLATHGTANGGDRNLYYDFQERARSGYMNANNSYTYRLLDPASSDYRGNSKTNEQERLNYFFVARDRQGNKNLNTSASGFFGTSTSFPLVTFEETTLTLAEALVRTDDLPGALDALNALRDVLDKTFTEGNYDPYVLADFGPGGIVSPELSQQQALLKEIVEERYVTLTGQIEVFNDVRRTKNLLGITPSTGNQLPQRFLYSQNELNSNPNVPKPLPGLFEPTAVNK